MFPSITCVLCDNGTHSPPSLRFIMTLSCKFLMPGINFLHADFLSIMAHESGGYSHADSCIPGPGVNLLTTPLYESCSCVDECVLESATRAENKQNACTCMTKCMAYDSSSGCLRDEFLSDYSQPVFECNSGCSCRKNCVNRTSQRGPFKMLSLRPTEGKGLGVFAATDMLKGTFVAEYTGEILSLTMARERLKGLQPSDSCYVVIFREHLASANVVCTCIDASYHGNISRFINHSCAPNLLMVAVRTDSVVPRLCLFTCQDVKAGEEICFSYFSSSGGIDRSSIALGKRPCLCGASDCVGFLPLESLGKEQ